MLNRVIMLAVVGAAALAWTGAADAAKLGRRCGGPLAITCGSGMWCDPTPGHCRPGAYGHCVKVPEVCPFEIFAPVCGCNGRDYTNDCFRIMNKEAKKHNGKC
jgi:hypothetical protein